MKIASLDHYVPAWFLGAVFAVLVSVSASASAWTIEAVVPAGSSLSSVIPKAISNSGYIVGVGTLATGQRRAFVRYPGGNVVVLGALGGTDSWAEAVSDNGVVVGYVKFADGTEKPFFTTPGAGAMSLVPLLPGWTKGRATAVRRNGTMVGGWAFKTSPILSTTRPFWYSNGTGFLDIGLLPPDFIDCRITGMNGTRSASGRCTGVSKPRAFFRDLTGNLHNLGTLPGRDSSEGVALNDNGRVIGHSWNTVNVNGFPNKIFLSAPNGGALAAINLSSDFAADQQFASAINNADQIVGRGLVSTPNGTLQSAWRWSAGTTLNLTTLPEVVAAGWTGVSDAKSVNDSGWIVGPGSSASGSGYLLKP